MKTIILIGCIIYSIYFIFFNNFKFNSLDSVVLRIMFNISTIIIFIIGIILVNIFNNISIINKGIKIFYIGLIIISLAYNLFIKGIIGLLHLASKQNRIADAGYKLQINLLPTCLYLIIVLN